MAAASGELDALFFNARIGEHRAQIRSKIGAHAAWLGVKIDEEMNNRAAVCISPDGANVSAWVIPTNEDLMIARHMQYLLQ